MKRTTTQFGITSNTGHVCLVNSDISLLYAKKTDLVTSPKYKRYSPFRLYNVFLQAWRTSQTKHCFCIPSNQAERKFYFIFIIREVPIRAQQVVIKIQNNCFILTRNFM